PRPPEGRSQESACRERRRPAKRGLCRPPLMRFFFYGTLLDRDVTALVLGRRLPASAFVPAILPGWSRWRVQGSSYPISVPDRKGVISGAIVSGLSARD